MEGFEADFWPAYPRKVKKPRALKAWLAVRPWTQGTLDAIMDGLDRWKRYWADEATPPRFIPHPSTFLNDRQWENQP